VTDPSAVPAPRPGVRGVITDWGGVMTNPLLETVRAWIEADGIDFDRYLAVMRPWVSAAYEGTGVVNPIHALERGECSDAEFERLLAGELVRRDGTPVAAEGLLARMFAASVHSETMQHLLRAVRAAGLRTALLSNSWGFADYPRHLFPELFDAVVLSGEVGMRKPEERIFRHAAGRLGLAPDECVFIDDIQANVLAAEETGMTGILHTTPAETACQLAGVLEWPGLAEALGAGMPSADLASAPGPESPAETPSR
jgi:putative hydrolase of the HAD superfamily